VGAGRSTPGRLILRAKIVLAAADGKLNQDIAAELGTGMKTVCLWCNRFAKSGLAGIERDAPRAGRPPDSSAAAEIVRITTTLFAALIVSDGLVIEACMKRHRHQEWIKFLEKIDASTDPKLDLHLGADNYATHKHPKVKRWLKKHPRFHMHFTPTSSSWLNLVERWFREITQKRLRRGTFRRCAN
jgi:transposase